MYTEDEIKVIKRKRRTIGQRIYRALASGKPIEVIMALYDAREKLPTFYNSDDLERLITQEVKYELSHATFPMSEEAKKDRDNRILIAEQYGNYYRKISLKYAEGNNS